MPQNTVLISCIQADCERALKDTVPKYAYGRITSYANTSLAPLLSEQALDLVAARLRNSPELALLWKPNADRVWPLTEDEIRRVVGEAGCTPRELLSFCAPRFAELQSATEIREIGIIEQATIAVLVERRLAVVLNASRHHRTGHNLVHQWGVGTSPCSTPLGIIEQATPTER